MSRGLGDTARAFATAFADRDQVEPYCWSVNELADLVGITPRAARMSVALLYREGLIGCYWKRDGDYQSRRGRGPFYSLSTPDEIERARAARAACLAILRSFGGSA